MFNKKDIRDPAGVTKPADEDKHTGHYSDRSFGRKLRTQFGKMGVKLAWKALTLFILVRQKRLNLRNRAQAIAALGYLIMPIDTVPDMIPFVGYVDDLAAIALVLNAIWRGLDKETRDDVRHAVSTRISKMIKTTNKDEAASGETVVP